eukprot:7055060-Prymnesium_polylepis.1
MVGSMHPCGSIDLNLCRVCNVVRGIRSLRRAHTAYCDVGERQTCTVGLVWLCLWGRSQDARLALVDRLAGVRL